MSGTAGTTVVPINGVVTLLKFVAVTVILLLSAPGWFAVTTICGVMVEPPLKLPRLQVTTPPECEQPDEADTKLTDAGRVSVNVRLFAVAAPLLVMVAV